MGVEKCCGYTDDLKYVRCERHEVEFQAQIAATKATFERGDPVLYIDFMEAYGTSGPKTEFSHVESGAMMVVKAPARGGKGGA